MWCRTTAPTAGAAGPQRISCVNTRPRGTPGSIHCPIHARNTTNTKTFSRLGVTGNAHRNDVHVLVAPPPGLQPPSSFHDRHLNSPSSRMCRALTTSTCSRITVYPFPHSYALPPTLAWAGIYSPPPPIPAPPPPPPPPTSPSTPHPRTPTPPLLPIPSHPCQPHSLSPSCAATAPLKASGTGPPSAASCAAASSRSRPLLTSAALGSA